MMGSSSQPAPPGRGVAAPAGSCLGGPVMEARLRRTPRPSQHQEPAAASAAAFHLAVGETAILLTPPCLSLLKHLTEEQAGCHQNDRTLASNG